MTNDTKRPDGYDALPKRFKDYVQQLEARVCELQRSLPSRTPTGLKVVSYLTQDETYLPDGTRLEFTIGRERFQVYASKKGTLRIDGLEVITINGGLAVVPDCSNVVTIVAEKELR